MTAPLPTAQSQPIASLRYYDYPALRWAVDGWWTTLRQSFADQGFGSLPSELDRTGGGMDDACRSPDLIFGQTCGYPLTHELKDHVQPIATPHYQSEYCEGPFYRSVILVRESEKPAELGDLAGSRVAINSWRSFSGYIALQAAFVKQIEPEPFFGQVILTGNHLNSIKAIVAGEADCCACDCVSYELVRRLHPDLYGSVAVAGVGPLAPGLPFVTAIGRDQDQVARLRRGLFDAMRQPSAVAQRQALLLEEISVLDLASYAPIVELVTRLSEAHAELLFPSDQPS